jgi:hypothetical protein
VSMTDDAPTFDRRDEAMRECLRREAETRYLHDVVPTPDGRYRVEIVRG